MSGLRIAVDGRSLVGGPARGIAHYVAALLDAWPEVAPEDDVRVVLPRGGPLHLRRPLLRGPGGPGVRAAPSPVPSRVLFAAAALARRPRLDRLAGGCDVAWLPAPAPVAIGAGVPYVLTVQDRSWEERPEDFTRYERAWHVAAQPRRLARRATRVLTTTAWEADAIADGWGIERARIDPVGLAPAVLPETGVRAGARSPYLLFVGALEPRKGPDVLADALVMARSQGLTLRLLVVGGGRLDGLLAVDGVEAAGPVDDAALSRLYAGATALVVPSRLEGYGLPALEALAHATPVITSDLPQVREVLGDRATFVPAGDPAALAVALLAAEDTARPAATTPRTWAEVAAETRAVLAEAAG